MWDQRRRHVANNSAESGELLAGRLQPAAGTRPCVNRPRAMNTRAPQSSIEIAADILARSTPTAPGGGIEWIRAENQTESYWPQSYTGSMQGAAGAGSLVVRLAGDDARADWKVPAG